MNSKTILFGKMAVAVCCLVFVCLATSCSKDEETESVYKKAAVTINTAELYNGLGISADVNKALQSEGYDIDATLLIYNAQGVLVKKYVENLKNLEPIHFDLNELADGSYTMVAYQEGRIEKADAWEMVGEESLSTVYIKQLHKCVVSLLAIGTDGKVVEIKNGQAEVSLTPKAAGTLMDVDIDRDEEFNNKVNIWMDKAPTGLFLNPQLNEDERLTYKEENTWGVVISPLNEKGSTSYFILARGKQYFDADYYDENDQEWKELWWGQYVNIESGKKTMFYYDCHPQLMYKCYLGSREKYADWKQAHDTKGLKLEPIVPFGTNLDVLEEAIHDSPFDINEEYEMRQIGSDWVKIHNLWPSGELVVVYFYETQDGKNAKACTYQYDGPLFPFEQMREEIVKWGYEYKGFFTDPTLQLPNYVYLTPDGKDEIQIWESVTSSGEVEGWQICLHPYDQEDFDRIAEQQNGSGN